MTHLGDVASSFDTVARWCNLAERRLEYLTNLFETGRWRRYHSEQAFLENIQEAKAAVETWRDLMAREAAPVHLAIDSTKLHRHATSPHQDEVREPMQLIQLEPAAIHFQPPREIPDDVLVALESQLLDQDETPSVPDLDDLTLPALNLDRIKERYPVLHNAL